MRHESRMGEIESTERGSCIYVRCCTEDRLDEHLIYLVQPAHGAWRIFRTPAVECINYIYIAALYIEVCILHIIISSINLFLMPPFLFMTILIRGRALELHTLSLLTILSVLQPSYTIPNPACVSDRPETSPDTIPIQPYTIQQSPDTKTQT